MKKTLLITIAAYSAIIANAYDFQYSGIYYNKLTNSTAEVTYLSEDGDYSPYSGFVTIPGKVYDEDYNEYTVTGIGEQAFYQSTGMTAITIPNTVTTIGQSAFLSCKGLTNVSVPASVTLIGSYAFTDCDALRSIDVDSGNMNYTSIKGVLFNKDTTNLICYPGGKTGDYTIPNTVKTIGTLAFTDCTGLAGLTISPSVTTIGTRAFDFSSLTSVVIPLSVTTINEAAFRGCTKMTSVKVEWTLPENVALGKDVFKFDVFRNCTLIVPKGTKDLYSAADQWKQFTNVVEDAPSGVDDIHNATTIEVARYDFAGHYLSSPVKGLNIVKMSDGSIKKIIVKY